MKPMTLAQWSELSGVPITIHPSGSAVVPFSHRNPLWRALWHVSDYVVSSQMCGMVWLVKIHHEPIGA